MGNEPSSPSQSPCFDDQVYTTLSWAHDNNACRKLFDNCTEEDDKVRDDPSSREIVSSETFSRQSLQDDFHAVPLLPIDSSSHSPRHEDKYLPALTDNLTSSEPSSNDDGDNDDKDDGHDHFHQYAARTGQQEQYRATQQRSNVIILHHHAPPEDLNQSHSAEDYLERMGEGGAPSHDYSTQGTSGSLERDARADLGTSRGSSVQGREGYDDLDDFVTDMSSGRFDQREE